MGGDGPDRLVLVSKMREMTYLLKLQDTAEAEALVYFFGFPAAKSLGISGRLVGFWLFGAFLGRCSDG